ncbi:MAG: hypothetical protein MSC31_17060 [Solirubrobacteraceae bacterium MAG38_C4-C5]|nr:hypothetical protein [Candidatus Siliceabacter maunaloa]
MAGRPQGLGPFLDALGERLDALDARELRAAVLAHAEQLEPRERAPLLARFAAGRPAEVAAPGLLADVEAFTDRLCGGAYFDDWGWDDDLHEERAWGDESWVGEMDALFARASEAFLAGDLELAADAYGALLEALTLDGEVGAFSGPGTPEVMVATDLGEAKARALRARFETTPAPYCAALLDDQMEVLAHVGPRVGLKEIIDALPGALDGLAPFLDDWVALLTPPSDARRRALAVEAVLRRDGVDGLATLARAHGLQSPELFEAWVGALEGEAAARACREALDTIAPCGEPRARIAERLAATGEEVEGRREAWRAAPTMTRLRALAAALPGGDGALAIEADRLDAGADVPGGPAAALLALDGRADAVMALLETAPPLGWSGREHPGPVAVAFALLLALEAPTDLERRAPHVAQQLSRLDLDPPWLADRAWLWADPDDDDGRPDAGEPPALSVLLTERARGVTAPASRRAAWLELATAAVTARVGAIVEAKRRHSYERAAGLLVACAEARGLALDPASAGALVREIRQRYPRHVAFRSALDAATRRSPLLPSPPARR